MIPPLILGLVYLMHGISPWGDKTVLISDLSGQYIDFYSAYYEILSQGRSILYSWQAGMGLNFLGLFSYYLASPFSALVLLFDKQHLTDALLFITLLKVGSAGLTFAFYAGYMFRNSPGLTPGNRLLRLSSSDLILLCFSVLYALMAYSVVYSFNLMWLDGVIFLPLILMGTEKLLRENKYILLVISLFVLFIANYYISYMAGLFSFLYFLAAFITRHSFQEISLFIRKLALFAFSAMLAAGCAAILLVPTFFALKNGQGSPVLSLGLDWQINFSLLDLLTKVLPGAYDSLQYRGLPNIYCGLFPLLLVSLYFFNKKIPVRERLVYALLMGFLIICFNFKNLNLMWHAFDNPDWFPYRYSFVFSFLILFLSLRCFCTLIVPQDKAMEYYVPKLRIGNTDVPKPSEPDYSVFKLSDIIKAGTFWIILIILLQKMPYPFLSDKMLMISIFLLGGYALLLAWSLRTSRFWRNLLLICLSSFLLLETSLNCWYLIGKMDEEFKYVSKQKYEQTLSKLEPFIPELAAFDQGFYRLDRIGGRSFNDPMNLNYPGITHFSSMSNLTLNKTLRQLGFLTTAAYKSVNFAGSTPITESLLGIKYVISSQEKGIGYDTAIAKERFKAYRNNYALPLGFLADSAVMEFDPTKDDNPFTLQNKLINLILGTKDSAHDFFQPISIQSTKLANATLTSEDNKEIVGRINKDLDAEIEFTLRNPRNQQVFACFQTITNEVRIFLNEDELTGYMPVYNKRIIDLGYHPQGRELRIKLLFHNQGFTLAEKYFYGLSAQDLKTALNPLQDQILQNIQITDTSVQGDIFIPEESKSILFTSIPYDPGWKVWIDGQKAAVRRIGRAFLGVELTKGQHEITFRFTPKGYQTGKAISGVSLLVLLLLIITATRKNKILRK